MAQGYAKKQRIDASTRADMHPTSKGYVRYPDPNSFRRWPHAVASPMREKRGATAEEREQRNLVRLDRGGQWNLPKAAERAAYRALTGPAKLPPRKAQASRPPAEKTPPGMDRMQQERDLGLYRGTPNQKARAARTALRRGGY